MDFSAFYDLYFSSDFSNSEPFLLTLRKKLYFFFLEVFNVSFDTLNRIISDYKLIVDPDFYFRVKVTKSGIEIFFILEE